MAERTMVIRKADVPTILTSGIPRWEGSQYAYH